MSRTEEPLIRFTGTIEDAPKEFGSGKLSMFLDQQMFMETNCGVMSFYFYWMFGVTAAEIVRTRNTDVVPLIRSMRAYRAELKANKGKRWGQK